MAKKVGRIAMKLLVDCLCGASGVQTSRGTAGLWASLEQAGYVTKMQYGGFLGHPFFYDLTDDGREAIKHAKAKGRTP